MINISKLLSKREYCEKRTKEIQSKIRETNFEKYTIKEDPEVFYGFIASIISLLMSAILGIVGGSLSVFLEKWLLIGFSCGFFALGLLPGIKAIKQMHNHKHEFKFNKDKKLQSCYKQLKNIEQEISKIDEQINRDNSANQECVKIKPEDIVMCEDANYNNQDENCF